MTYTPINWQTGDTITADRLNKMDNGWGVSSTQLFSEMVTTADQGDMNNATLDYSGTIDADTIAVTFDGTEYTCPRIDAFNAYYYGGFSTSGPDFTDYPFAIESNDGANKVYTDTAGTHTIAVAILTLQTSTDFDAARGWSYDAGGMRELFSETVTTAVDPEFPDDGLSAPLSYGKQIDANAITVTFDGTVYECPMNIGESYGATWSDELNNYDFSEFPFGLDGYAIWTQTAGEHTVSVDAMAAPSASVTGGFKAAVSTAAESIPFLVIDTFDDTTDKTWNEINNKFTNGAICIVSNYGPVLQMWGNDSNMYYMATGCTGSGINAFDPVIWKSAGTSPDTALSRYKYNSQMS